MNTRRAFTLLELALATLVSSLVIAATLTLFGAIERTDRKLEGRLERAGEIERTRRAFQNAFTTIATSDAPAPRRNRDRSGSPVPGASNPPLDSKADQGGQPAQGSENSAGASLPPTPAPRVVLSPDTGVESDPGLSALGVQRLEIVLSTNPVPVAKREGSEEARIAAAEDEADDDKRIDPTSSGGSQAIRGAFSFRGQTAPPGRDARADLASTPLMELWWVPLPPAQDDPNAEPLPLSMAAGYPTKLCSDVTGCQIRFFKGGEWISQHSAVWRNDLPAYAEVQMNFSNGQGVRWLMEIGFVDMAEVAAADPEAAGGEKPGSSALDNGTGGSRGRLRSENTRRTIK